MLRWRTITGLAVVLVALSLVAWWTTGREDGTGPTPTPPPRVIPIDVEDIQRVDIEQGEQALALQRSGEAWYILGTTEEAADGDEVERRLRSLVTMVSFDAFVPEDLAEFGLDTPQARVIIQAYTGTTVLLIGDMTPTENDYYVQRADDPTVYVVSRYLIDRVLEWLETPPYPATPTPTTPAE